MRMLPVRGPLACQEMVELITDYLEDALPRAQRRRFEAHLAGCEHCSEYLVQMRATIAVSGRLRAEDLTPAMRTEFGDIFRSWLAEDSAQR